MTNNRTTVVGPWTIGPADGDGNIPIYGEEMQFISARETREDLAHLRDALIQHLAPERPTGLTHRAIFSLKMSDGSMAVASADVTLAGPVPTQSEADAIARESEKYFGAQSAILTNLIPLAGA